MNLNSFSLVCIGKRKRKILPPLGKNLKRHRDTFYIFYNILSVNPKQGPLNNPKATSSTTIRNNLRPSLTSYKFLTTC